MWYLLPEYNISVSNSHKFFFSVFLALTYMTLPRIQILPINVTEINYKQFKLEPFLKNKLKDNTRTFLNVGI